MVELEAWLGVRLWSWLDTGLEKARVGVDFGMEELLQIV